MQLHGKLCTTKSNNVTKYSVVSRCVVCYMRHSFSLHSFHSNKSGKSGRKSIFKPESYTSSIKSGSFCCNGPLITQLQRKVRRRSKRYTLRMQLRNGAVGSGIGFVSVTHVSCLRFTKHSFRFVCVPLDRSKHVCDKLYARRYSTFPFEFSLCHCHFQSGHCTHKDRKGERGHVDQLSCHVIKSWRIGETFDTHVVFRIFPHSPRSLSHSRFHFSLVSSFVLSKPYQFESISISFLLVNWTVKCVSVNERASRHGGRVKIDLALKAKTMPAKYYQQQKPIDRRKSSEKNRKKRTNSDDDDNNNNKSKLIRKSFPSLGNSVGSPNRCISCIASFFPNKLTWIA